MKRIVALFCFLLAATAGQGKLVYTQVTCLYDIGRGDLSGSFKRSFQRYLQFFAQLLLTDSNLIIFGDKDLEEYVWHRRNPNNTVFVLKNLESLKEMWFYPHVQRLRQIKLKGPSFASKQHPQFTLQYYNPIMFSKMYLLEQAMHHDKFNSDYLIWTDAGINHIANFSLVSPENHLRKWFQFIQPQWLFFTYHRDSIYSDFANGSEAYVGVNVDQMVKAGFYGGYIEAVRDVRCTFENFLRMTLQNGDMNSDQSVVAMMPIKYSYLFPTTISKYAYQLYKNLQTHIDSNRKPEHFRFLRADFDIEGNIHMVNGKIYTRYIAGERESCITKYVNADQVGSNQKLKMLFEKSVVTLRQVLFREAVCLLFLVSIYVWMQASNKLKKIIVSSQQGNYLIEQI